MPLTTNHAIIEGILNAYKQPLGSNYTAYRNHVFRVFNLTKTLGYVGNEDDTGLAIAAAFHDLGIWTAHTFDYLHPSVELANVYLAEHHLQHMQLRVAEIILNHHKIRPYHLTVTVIEAFRKADLIDLSMGMVRFGVSAYYLQSLKQQFPYAGFHRFIVWMAVKNFIKHPLRPLPMMKW